MATIQPGVVAPYDLETGVQYNRGVDPHPTPIKTPLPNLFVNSAFAGADAALDTIPGWVFVTTAGSFDAVAASDVAGANKITLSATNGLAYFRPQIRLILQPDRMYRFEVEISGLSTPTPCNRLVNVSAADATTLRQFIVDGVKVNSTGTVPTTAKRIGCLLGPVALADEVEFRIGIGASGVNYTGACTFAKPRVTAGQDPTGYKLT